MIDVFVSRTTWVPAPFKAGLDGFLQRLADFDMKPRTLGATDYAAKSPLDEVIRLMQRCRGAVILGYPHVEVDKGRLKGTDCAGSALATEWNHIEAGLAYAQKLPLLVIHHWRVVGGIFDKGALNSFIFAKDLRSPGWCLEDDIAGALRTWRDDVVNHPADMPSGHAGVAAEIEKMTTKQTLTWTVRAYGRTIGDPKSLEDSYKEGAECAIEEITPYYVRIKNLASGRLYTVPLGDVELSHDDVNHRPLIIIRKK